MAHDAHQPEAEHKEVGLQRLQGDRRSCEVDREREREMNTRKAVHIIERNILERYEHPRKAYNLTQWGSSCAASGTVTDKCSPHGAAAR